MALRVLITDDSASMRKILKRSLTMSGLQFSEIAEAADGAEALHLFEERDFDLALVDLHMPGMNGLALIEALRSRPPLRDMPILVVTSDGSEEHMAAVKAFGAAILHKPFAPESLLKAVIDVLEG